MSFQQLKVNLILRLHYICYYLSSWWSDPIMRNTKEIRTPEEHANCTAHATHVCVILPGLRFLRSNWWLVNLLSWTNWSGSACVFGYTCVVFILETVVTLVRCSYNLDHNNIVMPTSCIKWVEFRTDLWSRLSGKRPIRFFRPWHSYRGTDLEMRSR